MFCIPSYLALILSMCALLLPAHASSDTAGRCASAGAQADRVRPGPSYVLGDTIAFGLDQEGLASKLQAQLGGLAKINYDAGRSITTPGSQVKKSALESVDIDRDHIAKASVIIVILGTNPMEASFEDSQIELVKKLKDIAPSAQYFWVDIGATISTQVPGWNARNKLIYDNAPRLGYRVISRYKSIFGATADPLQIKAGENFPGWVSEPGYGGPGNLHGAYAALSQAIMRTLSDSMNTPEHEKMVPRTSYLVGDSIAYGLHIGRLEDELKTQLGGPSKISYDAGRSITTAGSQIKKTALESLELDREHIEKASVIVVILGTNQMETSFADSQLDLITRLKAIAPHAQYFWVDIGATISTQVPGWNARNKLIYDNAPRLGYRVISRYKAIFGAMADPLNITPGQVFPGQLDEPGYGGPGNIHGAYAALSNAILAALPKTPYRVNGHACPATPPEQNAGTRPDTLLR